MNLFDKNLPVPHVPALHNVLAALTAFGCAAAILTGQHIAMADDAVVMFEVDTIKAKPLACYADGQGEGNANCELVGSKALSRAVAENLADNARCETTWISPFGRNGWRAFCGDSNGKVVRELKSR